MSLQPGVPADARSLIWGEFFASRGRGHDWQSHLPWADHPGTLCASLRFGDEAAAVLLVRPAPDRDTAMIGYVCVAEARRGQGLSRILLDFAASELAGRGYSQLALWTGKPGVYASSGFVSCWEERNVRTLPLAASRDAARLTVWPGPGDDCGLPPYASAGWRATLPNADDAIIFVDTPTGATLLDPGTDPEAAIRIMASARPVAWSATLDREDPLYLHLRDQRLCDEDRDGPHTMYRALGPAPLRPRKVPLTSRI